MTSDCLIDGSSTLPLSPLDRGFAYGDGVFRTLQVRDGHPLGWLRHYRKLSEDCERLGIACPASELLLADIRQLCGGASAGIKLVITRGEGLRGYALPVPAKPTRVALRFELPEYPQQYGEQGVRLHLCTLRLAEQPLLAGIKHLNRLENVLARMEWNDADIAEGLLLDAHERVIECTASNLFLRNGNTLLTPALERCGVAGVTRQRILELAPRLGYAVEVADIHLPQLLQADEAVICNSLYGAWQVRELCDRSWPRGELAGRLRACLDEEDAPAA